MALKFVLISFILFAISVSCFSRVLTQDRQGETSPSKIQSRIINGVEADEDEFPYIVAINTTFGKHICGGSILDSRHILTAAHCLNWPVKFLRILTGVTDLSYPDAVYTVKEKVIHRFFNQPWMHNDIGLLVLEEEIEFNDCTQPIKMAEKNELEEGEMLKLSGWGAIKTYGRSSPILQTVEVEYISYEDCEEGVLNADWLGEENICTSTKSGVGSCNNDSGGPLVNSDDELVAVVNWGEACATGRPDVHSSVVQHKEWINDVINGERD